MRNAKNNNLVLNAKLGWRIMNEDSPMWIKMLKAKYDMGKNPSKWKKKNKTSHIWKSIHSCKEILTKATKWTVANGRNIMLWKDWWCGNCPLEQVTNIVGDDSATVSSIIDQNGLWNTPFIDQDYHEVIKSVPLPVALELEDSVSWTPNGKFSTASCYKFILESEGKINANDFNWDWIWKIKIPPRITTFVWTLFHNKILSNQNCVIRSISNNSFCKTCNHLESSLHIFRDCEVANQVWNLFEKPVNFSQHTMSLTVWL